VETGELHRLPNNASIMFWADAVATEVISVVRVMQITPMTLRLKQA
jgi:hypothetical protein